AAEDQELRQEVAERDQDHPGRDGPFPRHASRSRGAGAPAHAVRAELRELAGEFSVIRASHHGPREIRGPWRVQGAAGAAARSPVGPTAKRSAISWMTTAGCSRSTRAASKLRRQS